MTSPEPKKIAKDTLALRLIAMRHELGLSQREASIRTGVPFGVWQGMESGRGTRNLAEVIEKIEEHLDYDRNWLMWGTGVNRGSQDDNDPLTDLAPASETEPDTHLEAARLLPSAPPKHAA